MVSGSLWHGGPRRILDAARDGIVDLFTSPELLEELRDVLCCRKFAARLREAQVSVSELVLGYSALTSVIATTAIDPAIIADPDDDVVLSCAVACQSEVIASGDSHLLDLRVYQGIRVLTPVELLAELSL